MQNVQGRLGGHGAETDGLRVVPDWSMDNNQSDLTILQGTYIF